MFGAERYKKIKEIIIEKKIVDVSTLSTLLSVTEVTIRKDLEKLEREGFITKTHGGAILNQEILDEHQRMSTQGEPAFEYFQEKSYIGEIAAHMIRENDSVFLGPGSTCYCIAKALHDRKNINVVTNNLRVVNVLAENNAINVLLTGGNLSGSTMALTGEIVQKSLDGIFIDKSFISVNGVHISNGFTVANIEELNVFRKIAEISNELIIVADYSKFGRTSFVKLGPTKLAKKVITNENIPVEYKAHFFDEGIPIFTSYEMDE